jgi:spermidine synthase
MRIAKPDLIELDYTQRMLAGLLWLPAVEVADGHAVQLGLGAGSLTRFCLKQLRMRCTAVELNPAVIRLCRQQFHLPHDHARLQVVNIDAARWVAQAPHRHSVQLLHIDLYDDEAAAPVLDSVGFYRDCRAVLAEGGVMSVNLFGRDLGFGSSLARIVEVFGVDRVCGLRPTREGNTVVLAWRGGAMPDRPTLIERAAEIERRFGTLGVPARKWLRMLRPVARTEVQESAVA